MHGGNSPGAPRGNQHNFKHGFYSAAAIAERREMAQLRKIERYLRDQIP